MKIEPTKSAKIVMFIIIALVGIALGIYLEIGVSMPFEITAVPDVTPMPESTQYIIAYDDEGRLDINMATKEELDTIKGIGEATAEKIIEYREEHGPFDAIEELTNISGIGMETVERMRESICVR